MSSLQNVVESNASGTQLLSLNNLRNCVQPAASIVSSASTTLGVEHAEGISVTYGSEFGDCFPSEPGETMLRWISSNTVYKFEEENAAESLSKRRNLVSGNLQSVEESAGSEQSDSDTDLEVEKFQALMKQGKKKFREKDFGSAERLFRNCLARISSNVSITPLHHIPISEDEIMEFLLSVYLAQEKWDEAQFLLLEKISVESRDNSRDSGGVLMDLLTLVDVLIYKKSYAEALLYGRRVLKGYRKMGSNGVPGVESSLKALVRVCHMDGNYDEEDAYAAILSDFFLLNTSELHSPDATQSNAQRPSSSTRAPNSPVGPQQINHHPKKRQTNISDAEQPLNKAIQEDITAAQKSGILEGIIQLLEDDSTYLPSEHVPDPG
ncbi:hypothetical protein B0J14DRAFT_336766 [Halenospora varia]|nr:hypothetical protein B0J14DRAFT_336766 [Halenospora varia]